MKREDVYKIIDEERDFQCINNIGTNLVEYPIAEWLLFIESSLNKAKLSVCNLRRFDALEEIRKIAALSVACMKFHRAPEREIEWVPS